MDLLKALDTVNHGLMLAKLKTDEFLTNALKLTHDYLKNRKQKVQINKKSSLTGVSQRFVDRPLLLNLFINDLVLFIRYSEWDFEIVNNCFF